MEFPEDNVSVSSKTSVHAARNQRKSKETLAAEEVILTIPNVLHNL